MMYGDSEPLYRVEKGDLFIVCHIYRSYLFTIRYSKIRKTSKVKDEHILRKVFEK